MAMTRGSNLKDSPADRSQPEANATDAAPGVSGHGRWRRRLMLASLVLVGCVFAAPYILTLPVVRGWLLQLGVRNINGSVEVNRFQLGWWSPFRVEGVAVKTPNAQPAITVKSVEGSQPLWRQVLHITDWQEIRVQEPHLHLYLKADRTTNLKDLLKPSDEPTKYEPPKGLLRHIHGRVALQNAGVTVTSDRSAEPWTVDQLNLAAELMPMAEGRDSPTLVIDNGVLMDREPLTRAMCDDVLKFIVPALSDASNAPHIEGQVSVEVQACSVPLDSPGDAALQGKLTIHHAQLAGSGPLVQAIAGVLGYPPEVTFANETVIDFSMQSRRVEHQSVAFYLPGVQVRTHGSVGLDQSLDLVAEIVIDVTSLAQGPVASELREHPIQLPIKGTLQHPEIDAAGLSQSSVGAVTATLKRFLKERQASGEQDPGLEVLDQLLDSPLLGDGQLLGRFIDRLRERRPAADAENGLDANPAETSNDAPESADAEDPEAADGSNTDADNAEREDADTSDKPRRTGPVRRMRDRLRQRREPPSELEVP